MIINAKVLCFLCWLCDNLVMLGFLVFLDEILDLEALSIRLGIKW